MNASVLDRTVKAYRIGSADNQYPIFDSTGSLLFPGRWNEIEPVIYTAENFSLALLEKLVHTNTGDIPSAQCWIEIIIPPNITYQKVTPYSLTDWHKTNTTKSFGDQWLKSKQSCLLIVPSIIAPVENNILINPNHLEFHKIEPGINQPVIWDRRLFTK